MATFGWVLLAGAFLVLIMVANNSWPFVWAKIRGGIPPEGSGNRRVPVPENRLGPENPPDEIPDVPSSGIMPGTIVPVPANRLDGDTGDNLPPLPFGVP